MSIVKTLPAVLIAAVGISFSFAGTALAEEPIFAEKTLGVREDLEIRPPNMLHTKICFKATDNLKPNLMIMNMRDPQNLQMIRIPRDMGSQTVSQESDHQCITIFMRKLGGRVINLGYRDSDSKSVHVYVRQEYTN